jgi:hypothetical protein
VRVAEEDTAAGEVYRADGEAIPKSRRPRETIVLHADGSATLSTGGPDDRRVSTAARWTREAGVVVLHLPPRPGGRAAERRVVGSSPDRLVLAR